MRSETSTAQAISDRLEKLERQNRTIKGVALAALATLGALVLMGQSKRPGSIEASAFIVRDSTGEIRAKLAMHEGNAELQMFDQQGRETAAVNSLGSVFLFDRRVANKGTILSGRELSFYANGSDQSYLNAHGLALGVVGERAAVGILEDGGAGRVVVTDSKGFKAVLGREPLENRNNGSEETTSAASLVLFNEKDQVIWQAP